MPSVQILKLNPVNVKDPETQNNIDLITKNFGTLQSGLAAMQAQITALQNAAIDFNTPFNQTEFTPNWGATGSPPDIGDGSIMAFYVRMGDVSIVTYQITIGSTSTFGTGSWTFGMPPGQVIDTSRIGIVIGGATPLGWMASTQSRYYGGAAIYADDNHFYIGASGSSNLSDATTPESWASTHTIMAQVFVPILGW